MMIIAENISRTFLRQSSTTNIFYAVTDASIEIAPGKIIEIIGKSGSGKSTFLNMLAGLLTPSKGKVLFNDQELYMLSEDKRAEIRNQYIGFIPQGQSAINSLSVKENIELPLLMYRKQPDEDYLNNLMQTLEIDRLKDIYPNELSGGELRRMAVARAMAIKPKVILADEPTGDLDDENTNRVLEMFKQAALNGSAVLIVTHDRAVDKYADEIYIMNNSHLTKSQISY